DGGPKQRAGGLWPIWLCQRRWFAFLRSRPVRHLSPRRLLCRSHSARRETGRSPGAVSGEIRDGREPQDRQDARPCHTPIDSAPRRGGDRMIARINRRETITLLGGAAAWPLAARAQQGDRVRRIGVLMPGTESDEDEQSRLTAFQRGLAKAGWTDGRN